jgi:hypothetical protein
MAEETMGSDSCQMKCPHCGEMINISAATPDPAEGKEEGAEWEQGLREDMSPRSSGNEEGY